MEDLNEIKHVTGYASPAINRLAWKSIKAERPGQTVDQAYANVLRDVAMAYNNGLITEQQARLLVSRIPSPAVEVVVEDEGFTNNPHR